MKNPDEKLWCILSVVFEEDSVFYSLEVISKSCFDAGYTDMVHIRNVHLEEILPVCLIPLCICTVIAGFKEEWIALAANTHTNQKRSIVYAISPEIVCFIMLFLLFCKSVACSFAASGRIFVSGTSNFPAVGAICG